MGRDRSKIRAGVVTFIVATAAGLAMACGSSDLAPLPLDLTLTANKTTAAVGDTISFVANGQGGSLFGFEVTFGDNTTTLLDAHGARTIRATFKHVYNASGSYLVNVTLTDVQGSKDASLQIAIP